MGLKGIKVGNKVSKYEYSYLENIPDYDKQISDLVKENEALQTQIDNILARLHGISFIFDPETNEVNIIYNTEDDPANS